MSNKALSVKTVAEQLGVGVHVVLRWIASGELRAIDVSTNPNKGRPTWRIHSDALAAFENTRTPQPVQRRKRRRKKSDSEMTRYFS